MSCAQAPLLLLLAVVALSSLQLLSGCEAFAPSPASPFFGRSSQALIPSAEKIAATASRRFSRESFLFMGIRSFIKRKIKKFRRDDHDGEGRGCDANGVSLHSVLQAPGSAGLIESPVSTMGFGDSGDGIADGTDANEGRLSSKAGKSGKLRDSKKHVDIIGRDASEKAIYEDSQDRIRRMKGGGMTEEEKMDFLNNALTRTLPRQKAQVPPIRQKIPVVENANGTISDIVSGDTNKHVGKIAAASASTTENLWNTLINNGDKKEEGRGRGSSSPSSISLASLMMDGKMKDEEAKRRYMESITNPDRFAAFSAYQPHQASMSGVEEDCGGDDGDRIEGASNREGASEVEASLKDGHREKREGKDDNNLAVVDETNFAQMKRQIAEDRELLNPKEKPEQNAAREAVESILSMISSNNDKKVADAVASDGSQSKGHLAARLGQAAEAQEKRDKEARLANIKKREDEKRELDKAQKKREEDLRRREVERIERARKIAEDERRKEEEKLAAERAELEARQVRQDEYWAKKLQKERAMRRRSEPLDAKRKREVMQSEGEEKADGDVVKQVKLEKIGEDPDERDIPDEATETKIRHRKRVRNTEVETAARLSRTVSTPSKEDVPVSSFVREQQRKKEEIDRQRRLDEQSLKSLNSPLPSPGKMNRVDGLTPQIQRAPPTSSSLADLSLSSLTMGMKSDDGGLASPPAGSPLLQSSPQPLDLGELTKVKKDPDIVAAARKSRPTKQVVRQQLPLLARSSLGGDMDYGDDDNDDLMRSGAPGLTVADALRQQRKKADGGGKNKGKTISTSDVGSGQKKGLNADEKAKQWGIDMSKFK